MQTFAGFTFPRLSGAMPSGTLSKRLALYKGIKQRGELRYLFLESRHYLAGTKAGEGYFARHLRLDHLRAEMLEEFDGGDEMISGAILRLPKSRGFLAFATMGAGGYCCDFVGKVFASEHCARVAAVEHARELAESRRVRIEQDEQSFMRYEDAKTAVEDCAQELRDCFALRHRSADFRAAVLECARDLRECRAELEEAEKDARARDLIYP